MSQEDEHIEAFLLGRCDEAASASIEERLFTDDAFFERMQQIKSSLLRDHALGQLSRDDATALNEQAARSPRLLRELNEARTQTTYQVDTKTPQPALTTPIASNHAPRAPWLYGLGFAAVVLAITAAVLSRLPAPPVNHATQAPVPASAPVLTSPIPATVLFLPAGVLRGGVSTSSLSLPDLTRPVELQIQIRTSDDPIASPGPWSATLFRAGRPVVSSVAAIERSEGNIRYLSLPFAAGVLSAGDYHLTLTHPGALSAATPPLQKSFTLR